MKTKASIASIVMLVLLLGGIAHAVPPKRVSSADVKEEVYVYRAKGQGTCSIILRPHGRLLYGNGGYYGTRHKYVAGVYQIKGNTIILYEYNGHKYLTEGHQTNLPFTSKIIHAGIGKIYRRL